MEKIGKLDVATNGLVSAFAKLVSKWRPPVLKTEIAYSNDLADFLRQRVPDDAKIEREYRHLGTTMDLHVTWAGLLQKSELFVEVKRNLQKKPDFDRLVGQIEGMKPGKYAILIVLVGDTDSELLGRLKEKYRPFMEDLEGDEALEIVAVKPGVAPIPGKAKDNGWF